MAQRILAQTKREFRVARFNKPAKSEAGEIEHKLAPLIVEEFGEATTPRMGEVSVSPPKKSDVIPFKPATVYFDERDASSGSSKLDEVVFVWWYEQWHECHLGITKPTFLPRGARIIVGFDGTPILWEALTDHTGPRVFFVSQSLELAAKKQFGQPLPGRNFSIERGISESPNVVVTGVLDDGPVPMGPYVYIDASSQRAMSTIHCRCSPSQFSDVVETIEYQLEPLKGLDLRWLHEEGGIDVGKLLEEPIDKLFRWPKL